MSLFNKLFSLFPRVKAEDEDLVDHFQVARDKCAQDQRAQDLYSKYTECNDRVRSRKNTAETCVEELIDYVHHVDHCASHGLFSKLK